jgi:hypothetical protein
MAGAFNALQIRDLVALVVIASRTVREGVAGEPRQLVQDAFDVADEFVRLSEGRWAEGARETHRKVEGKDKP